MIDSEEPPAEILRAIGAALLLGEHSGGGLFGRLAYAPQKEIERSLELSFDEEGEP